MWPPGFLFFEVKSCSCVGEHVVWYFSYHAPVFGHNHCPHFVRRGRNIGFEYRLQCFWLLRSKAAWPGGRNCSDFCVVCGRGWNFLRCGCLS